ncbi:MAG: hypothetical protein R3321_15330, partial [Nitrososphaeraceae archaeon]|nr:hypothetical protein [Nitrososphaeraceae archaeon]
NQCANLIARTTLNGVPVNGQRVTLEGPDGTETDQGITQNRTLNDGRNFNVGEIPIKGAHLGDVLRAVSIGPTNVLFGSIRLTSCGPNPVDIPLINIPVFPGFRVLSREAGNISLEVSINNFKEQILSLSVIFGRQNKREELSLIETDKKGKFIARLKEKIWDDNLKFLISIRDKGKEEQLFSTYLSVSTAWEEEQIHGRSVDGQIQVSIPTSKEKLPYQLIIEDVVKFSNMPLDKEDKILIGPYRVSSPGINKLEKLGTMLIKLGGIFSLDDLSKREMALDLMRFDEDK